MGQDTPREWWTVSELAKAAGVDTSYIRQLLIAGKLHGEKFGPIWRIIRQGGQTVAGGKAGSMIPCLPLFLPANSRRREHSFFILLLTTS